MTLQEAIERAMSMVHVDSITIGFISGALSVVCDATGTQGYAHRIVRGMDMGVLESEGMYSTPVINGVRLVALY